MKQCNICILIVLLLLSTSGVNVRLHYCGEDLQVVSLYDIQVHAEPQVQMSCCKSEKGCPECHSKQVSHRLDEQLSRGQSVSPDSVRIYLPMELPGWAWTVHGIQFLSDAKAWNLSGRPIMGKPPLPSSYIASSDGVRGSPALGALASA